MSSLDALRCPCACHDTARSGCNVVGGCGSLHRADDEVLLRCRRGPRSCVDVQPHDVVVTMIEGRREVTRNLRDRVPAWATVRGGLCRSDTQVVRRAVEQLPADYRELWELVGKGSTGGGAMVSSSRELPVPIRLGVEALAASILTELERWAVEVADGAGFVLNGGRPQARADCAGGWLAALPGRFLQLPPMRVLRHTRFGPVVDEEDGVDGAIMLLTLHDQVTSLAGRDERAERLWTPCPYCHRVTLEHPEGRDFVHCVRCAHRMSWADYAEQVRGLADAERAG